MGRYSSLTVVGALAGLDTVDTPQIDDDAVTYAKMQNVVADERILGNITAIGSPVAELTKAQVLTMLSVADGADVTGSNTPQVHENSHKASGSDEILLDELGTPTDVVTLNSSTTRHGLLKKLDNNSGNFLNGQGNWAEPAGSAVASGSYAGNNTANRAIPHGLGTTPKYVIIYLVTAESQLRFVHKAVTGYLYNASNVEYAVTVWDTTNFYVGNATSYSNSNNTTGSNYDWVAIA